MSMRERAMISLLFLSTLVIAPVALVTRPYESGPALAVIPPWADIDQILEHAGLREIAPLRAPFGVLVAPVAHVNPAHLRANGVWTLLDGAFIAAICGVDNV